MRGKRADDGIPKHLWRIHDDLYDLKGFTHPGGAHWLSLTRGTDITELFESHHINPVVHKMLSNFRFKRKPEDPPLPPRRSPFTFKEDGFYVTLRKKIWAAHGGAKRQSGASKVAAIGPSFESKVFAGTCVSFNHNACTVAFGAFCPTVSCTRYSRRVGYFVRGVYFRDGVYLQHGHGIAGRHRHRSS